MYKRLKLGPTKTFEKLYKLQNLIRRQSSAMLKPRPNFLKE